MSSAICFDFDQSKILSSGNGFIVIEWWFTPLSTIFQLYHGFSSHYSCISWVSPVLGWDSEVGNGLNRLKANYQSQKKFQTRSACAFCAG